MLYSQLGLILVLLFALACSAAGGSDVFPVGTFGGFIKQGQVQIPSNNGFLTFAADTNVSAHGLKWKSFSPGGKDFTLMEMRFPIPAAQGKLEFVDWSSLKVSSPAVSIFLSRTFPALQYLTQTSSFKVATALENRAPMKHMALVINGKITQYNLTEMQTVDLHLMSEPWILIWAGAQYGWEFDVPILLTLEKRPLSFTTESDGVKFSFASGAGSINVMPLRGLKRFDKRETENWTTNLPGYAIVEGRWWVSKLAAFPIGMRENHELTSEGRVLITDQYNYREVRDAWATVPTPIAPLPPVVVRAGSKGYPVQYPNQAPTVTSLATFYGPFSFVEGRSATFSIPEANALFRLPIPLMVVNSSNVAPVRQELERILTEKMPDRPSDYYVPNDDLALSLMCDAYPTLASHQALRDKIKALVPILIDGSFSEDRVPLSTEPVTNQTYRSPGKHPFENEPFDREWNCGRKLAAMIRCSENLDIALARKHWPKILGLYRYSQIFFDWVTGSVTSSVFGFNQLADGIHFNWEGVLGVARLAKLLGDEATYQDAAYRSSRQQLALFAIWYQAEWSKEIDYGIAHFSVQKLPNAEIETRGAVDAWVEDFGAATLEFRSHWQTANFLFYDNAAQYSLYRDFGIIEKVRRIEYQIMPALHPHWTDGNVMDPIDKQYYGAGSAVAHLLARAVLFHHDPTELYKIYNGYRDTNVTREWYTTFFYGNSGPLLLGIERAEAPVIEAPVSAVMIKNAVYDAKTKKSKIDFSCRASKRVIFRKQLATGGNWIENSVQCTQGRGSSIIF